MDFLRGPGRCGIFAAISLSRDKTHRRMNESLVPRHLQVSFELSLVFNLCVRPDAVRNQP
jgi:hypothetical protein